MAARRPARRRPSRRADRPRPVEEPRDARDPAGLGWSCAVIFLVGLALVALGAWGLLNGTGRGSTPLGLGISIVVGALLIVFAALLPWLADGPVRIGPLAVTLRIRARPARTARPARPARRRRPPGARSR